jgi:hypothetical protein
MRRGGGFHSFEENEKVQENTSIGTGFIKSNRNYRKRTDNTRLCECYP